MRKLFTIGVMFGLLCTVAYADKKYPMTAASIVPGARAEVAIGTDNNGNTSLKMTVGTGFNLRESGPTESGQELKGHF
jgi:hypothetical protein